MMTTTTKPLTVLRTAAGTPACVGQILKLREAGVRVVAADCDPLSVGFAFADAASCVPRVACPGYIERMLEICKRERVDWLLPALDEELLSVDQARARFASIGTRILLPDTDALRVCTDKLATYEFFCSEGIPTPQTVELDRLDTSDHSLSYPLIMKPRRGRGSQGIFVVRNDEESSAARAATSETSGYIVQTLLIGTEFTVDVLADLNGEPAVICPRRRIATDSGISVKSQVERNEIVEQYVTAIARKLKLVGLSNIQCFVTSADQVHFTEINARVAGTSILSEAAGASLFAGLVALLRGEPLPQVETFRQDLIMLRYWSEVYVTPRDVQRWSA